MGIIIGTIFIVLAIAFTVVTIITVDYRRLKVQKQRQAQKRQTAITQAEQKEQENLCNLKAEIVKQQAELRRLNEDIERARAQTTSALRAAEQT